MGAGAPDLFFLRWVPSIVALLAGVLKSSLKKLSMVLRELLQQLLQKKVECLADMHFRVFR